MSDEPEPSEKAEPVVLLGPGVERREDGHLYSKRTGRRIGGAVGQKWSPEKKQAMQEAQRLARERKAAEGPPAGGSKREQQRRVNAEAVAAMKPQALAVLKEIFSDPASTKQLRFNAAVKVLEYSDGKPIQRVETDQVTRIEYVLSPHEPVPLAAVPDAVADEQ